MHRTGYILVLDDDTAIGEVLLDILTDAGYVAVVSTDARHALDTIQRHPPALLLMDLHMPGMCGERFLAQLQAHGCCTDLAIVVVTASPAAAAPLLAQGVSECLAKPFDLDDLLACVGRYVRPAARAASTTLSEAESEHT